MIERDIYMDLISDSKANPQSPIEIVKNIQEIEDFESKTGKEIGMIDNLPFYKFRMDLYKVKSTNETFRYCNVEYDKTGAVSLIVIHTSGNDYLLLQRSFRVFINDYIYEIPRGFSSPEDISSLQTIIREIWEETSIDLKTVQHKICKLGDGVHPDTGLTNNLVDFYRVDIYINSEPILKCNDSKEFIDKYKLIPLSEIHAFLPKIKDGFTLCALAKAFL